MGLAAHRPASRSTHRPTRERRSPAAGRAHRVRAGRSSSPTRQARSSKTSRRSRRPVAAKALIAASTSVLKSSSSSRSCGRPRTAESENGGPSTCTRRTGRAVSAIRAKASVPIDSISSRRGIGASSRSLLHEGRIHVRPQRDAADRRPGRISPASTSHFATTSRRCSVLTGSGCEKATGNPRSVDCSRAGPARRTQDARARTSRRAPRGAAPPWLFPSCLPRGPAGAG